MLDAVEIKLGERSYCIRPTFGAIVRIERRLGKSILQLIGTTDDAPLKLNLTDIAVIIYEAIAATGERDLSMEKVGNLIMQGGGFGQYMTPIAQYLVGAITAGPEEATGDNAGDTKS
jgi:hypothetical protein